MDDPDQFGDQFDLPSFVSGLLAADTQEQFDPEAVQSALGAAMADLAKLRGQLKADTAVAAARCAAVGAEFHEELEDHSEAAHAISQGVDRLEQRFVRVSATAVRIGDRLSDVHTRQQRARRALDVLQAWDALNAVAPDDEAALPELFTDAARLDEAARLLVLLKELTHEMTVEGTGNARRWVQTCSERAEQALLDRFFDARAAGDRDGMAAAVDTLVAFNNAATLQQRFLFEVMQERLPPPAADADVHSPGETLSLLFQKIRGVCEDELPTIRAVFPDGLRERITQTLLQRIFSDHVYGIQGRLDQLLSHEQSSLTPVERLQVLLSAHLKADVLVEQLAAIDGISRSFLDAQAALLFRGYKDDYLERELAAFDAFADQTLAADGLGDALKAAAAASGGDAASRWMRSARLSRAARRSNANAAPPDAHEPGGDAPPGPGPAVAVDHEAIAACAAGMLAAPLAERVLAFAGEAVTRCRVMCDGDEQVADSVAQVFGRACGRLCDHLTTALELVGGLVPAPTASDPHVPRALFPLLRDVAGVVRALETHYEAVVQPAVALTPTTQTVTSETTHARLGDVESRVSQILQRALMALLALCERTLSAQQARGDFTPEGDLQNFDVTPACAAVVGAAQALFEQSRECLAEAADVAPFWAQFGLQLKQILIAHYRKFRFSTQGAFVLMGDVNHFRELTQRFGSGEVDEAFEELRELVSLFLAQPDNLAAIMQGGRLAQMDPALLAEFVKRRVDSSSVGSGGAGGVGGGWLGKLGMPRRSGRFGFG